MIMATTPIKKNIAQPLKDLIDQTAETSRFDYNQLMGVLKKNPEIVDAINKVYQINPNSPLFSQSLRPLIIQLSGEMDRIGANPAITNFYKNEQNLVGFGSENWFTGQNMGTPQWNSFQQIINSRAEKVSDDEFNKTFKKTQSERQQVKGIYRDPKSGAGIAYVMVDDKEPLITYINASGVAQLSTIPDPLSIYENAERFGIDLSGVETLGKQLDSKNIKYRPFELYGPTSDAGIDFAKLASGDYLRELTQSDFVQRRTQEELAKNTWAQGLGATIPDVVVQNQMNRIQQQGSVLDRYMNPMNAVLPQQLMRSEIDQFLESMAQKYAPTPIPQVATQAMQPAGMSMAQQSIQPIQQPNVSSLVDMISTNQTNLQQPSQPIQPVSQVMPQAQPANTYGYELGMLPSSFQFGAPMQVAPQATPLFSQQNLLAGTQWQPTMSDLTNIIANGQTTISR